MSVNLIQDQIVLSQRRIIRNGREFLHREILEPEHICKIWRKFIRYNKTSIQIATDYNLPLSVVDYVINQTIQEKRIIESLAASMN